MKSPFVLVALALLAATASASAATTATTATTATAADCSRPTPCLVTYAPICGSNGQTYANACVFNNAVCIAAASKPTQSPLTKLSDGACDGPTNPFCGLRCSPATELPVCGSDGATYSNPCLRSVAACKDTVGALTTVHSGECTAASALTTSNLR